MGKQKLTEELELPAFFSQSLFLTELKVVFLHRVSQFLSSNLSVGAFEAKGRPGALRVL